MSCSIICLFKQKIENSMSFPSQSSLNVSNSAYDLHPIVESHSQEQSRVPSNEPSPPLDASDATKESKKKGKAPVQHETATQQQLIKKLGKFEFTTSPTASVTDLAIDTEAANRESAIDENPSPTLERRRGSGSPVAQMRRPSFLRRKSASSVTSNPDIPRSPSELAFQGRRISVENDIYTAPRSRRRSSSGQYSSYPHLTAETENRAAHITDVRGTGMWIEGESGTGTRFLVMQRYHQDDVPDAAVLHDRFFAVNPEDGQVYNVKVKPNPSHPDAAKMPKRTEAPTIDQVDASLYIFELGEPDSKALRLSPGTIARTNPGYSNPASESNSRNHSRKSSMSALNLDQRRSSVTSAGSK